MAKDSAGTLGQAGSKKMQTPLTADFDRELPTALPDLLPQQRRILGHFYPIFLSPPSLGQEPLLSLTLTASPRPPPTFPRPDP